MKAVACEVSPLNCHWIAWNDKLPVCTRAPGPHHHVTAFQCSVCAFWDGDDRPEEALRRAGTLTDPVRRASHDPDPLNRESCPRCSSTDVIRVHRDALVQSFTCSICHQRW